MGDGRVRGGHGVGAAGGVGVDVPVRRHRRRPRRPDRRDRPLAYRLTGMLLSASPC
uniref:Uncharacterized protein n=1 Tax=Setaria viridis TaxID=4556 RepID=A0A4V6D0D9_SETVI|nr:hypothetical protein SEVIR_9G041350v2 [Setaria viridis]